MSAMVERRLLGRLMLREAVTGESPLPKDLRRDEWRVADVELNMFYDAKRFIMKK